MSNKNVSVTNLVKVVAEISTNQKISVETIRKCKPNFDMLNNGNWRKCMPNTKQLNALEILLSLSTNESFAFLEIVKQMKPLQDLDYKWYSTNHVKVIRTQLDAKGKQKLSRGISELMSKDLIRRTGQSKYLINPLLIIPTHFEREMNDYNDLNG